VNITVVMPGLALHALDPLAHGLGGSETAGLQLAAELARQGHGVVVYAVIERPFRWRGVSLLSGALFGRGGSLPRLVAPCHLVGLVPRRILGELAE
jgi:hypothetical protein